MDELGRVVIPIEIRKSLNIKVNDLIQIDVNNNKIILRKKSDECILCHSIKNLQTFQDKKICVKCIEKIKKVV